MMRIFRRILFFAFLVLYLVATPMTILYALGYLYQPGSERGLTKSGLISLGTTPDGARVFVGGSRFTRRTPTVIRDLLPGDYNLRLTLRDYQPWSGTVHVEAEKATVLDPIVLLPVALHPQRLSPDAFDELMPGPGPEQFLLARDNRAGGLLVFDAEKEVLRPLLPVGSPLGDAKVLARHLVEESNRILLTLADDGRDAYLWCRVDRDEPPEDVSRLFTRRPERVYWDRRRDDELFTLTDGMVSRLDIDDAAVYPDVLSRVRSMGVFRDRLYVLDQSNRFFRVSRDGGDAETAGKAPAGLRTLWGARVRFSLWHLDDNLTLFLGENGSLFTSRSPKALCDRGVEGIAPHPRQKSALVWDRKRLGILDRADADGAPGAGHAPRLRWILETAGPIAHAAWAYEGTHILYAAGDRLYLLGLPEVGGAPPREIAHVLPRSAFFFSERTGTVYILEPDRACSALRILPRRERVPRRAGAATPEVSP